MADSDDKLPLSRLIEAVTAELHKAEEKARKEREAGTRQPAIMEFEECELEMAVEIEAAAKAGVDVWVFKLGGGVKKTDANTIKVKFKRLEGAQLTYPSLKEGPGPELGKA
jgi:hypothetical protein